MEQRWRLAIFGSAHPANLRKDGLREAMEADCRLFLLVSSTWPSVFSPSLCVQPRLPVQWESVPARVRAHLAETGTHAGGVTATARGLFHPLVHLDGTERVQQVFQTVIGAVRLPDGLTKDVFQAAVALRHQWIWVPLRLGLGALACVF